MPDQDSQANDVPAMDQLTSHVYTFRNAIEAVSKSFISESLKGFPEGACGDTTLLLGTYLQETGYGTFDYMLGRRFNGDQWHTHAWLGGHGLIIDITADQFEEMVDTVVVTSQSDWHETFEAEIRHPADYRIMDARTVKKLQADYQRIVSLVGSK